MTMDLFDQNPPSERNWLPQDGTVIYYGRIIPGPEADQFYRRLLTEVAWEHDQSVIMGRHITTKRKVAWYGDQPFLYRYSGTSKTALPWLPVLIELKDLAEQACGERFNSCLLNLYHNGSEGMAWHSDAERELKKHGAIASLSLGAERKFAFKHKTSKQTVSLQLAHGSLLVMKDQTQSHWLHRLPPTRTVEHARVNLTFRTINNNQP